MPSEPKDVKVGDSWRSRVDCASVEVLTIDELTVSYRWDNGVTARRPIWEFLGVFDPPVKGEAPATQGPT